MNKINPKQWFKNKKPIVILAPMADYTDQPFCRICREVAGNNFVIFREMVSSEAIVRNNAKTLKMCEFDKNERPIVLQIFGSDPSVMSQAVKIINEKFRPDGIDINMGCPVPKIAQKNEAGAALMKNPDKAVEIIKRIKKDNPDVVLSVKTRLGWSNKTDILDFAPKLEQAGVELLTIHSRTKTQGYSGEADWKMIGQVKQLIKIPVIANGDIEKYRDKEIQRYKDINFVERCLEITKADGVMIGRGALGNPWIFVQPSIKNYESSILVKTVLRHAKYHLERYGSNSMPSFRKHLLWYFKVGIHNLPNISHNVDSCLRRNDSFGHSATVPLRNDNDIGQPIKNLKKLRTQLVAVESLEELENLLTKLFF